jgi:hypothetical protein
MYSILFILESVISQSFYEAWILPKAIRSDEHEGWGSGSSGKPPT